jgi:CheY-like chemotaxis protein
VTDDPRARVLLLVEDNPADADLVTEYLDGPDGESEFQVIHATRRADAVRVLREQRVDVILLDLSLPDGQGLSTLQVMREEAGDIPIVVLTGADDDDLALSCIDAGAQDYLLKFEVRPVSLRRAVGYAIYRRRGDQQRSVVEALARYRELSSRSSTTMITAAIVGSGALRERYPEKFAAIVADYERMMAAYVDCLYMKRVKPREHMEILVTQIGDHGGGPRDLLDVHTAVLEVVNARQPTGRAQALTLEGRLMALEMMGLLVDYYRVGHRRVPALAAS